MTKDLPPPGNPSQKKKTTKRGRKEKGGLNLWRTGIGKTARESHYPKKVRGR